MTVEREGEPGTRTGFVLEAGTREDPSHLTDDAGHRQRLPAALNAGLVERSFRRTSRDEYAFASHRPSTSSTCEMRGCLADTAVSTCWST